MSRVELLLSAGLVPVMVFDGGRLPNKGEEEASRGRSRAAARERARALAAAGNVAGAYEAYQRAVDVTPRHAFQLIRALRRRGVDYVVAPYEADAQMAHMATTGQVELVVSEDSDMLAYGCPLVLFKMDKVGYADEVRLADLGNNAGLDLRGWPHDLFLQLCIMSGCDFLPSLPGIGIKRAHAHLKRTRCFIKAVQALKWDGTAVPPQYLVRFQRALWSFRHQRVYCRTQQATIPMTPLPEGGLAASTLIPEAAETVEGEPDFLGPWVEDCIARGVAEGRLDPMTHQPFAMDLPSPTKQHPDRQGGRGLGQQPKTWAAPATQAPPGPSPGPSDGQQSLLSMGWGRGKASGFLALPTCSREAQRAYRAPRPASQPESGSQVAHASSSPAPTSLGGRRSSGTLLHRSGKPGGGQGVSRYFSRAPSAPSGGSLDGGGVGQAPIEPGADGAGRVACEPGLGTAAPTPTPGDSDLHSTACSPGLARALATQEQRRRSGHSVPASQASGGCGLSQGSGGDDKENVSLSASWGPTVVPSQASVDGGGGKPGDAWSGGEAAVGAPPSPHPAPSPGFYVVQSPAGQDQAEATPESGTGAPQVVSPAGLPLGPGSGKRRGSGPQGTPLPRRRLETGACGRSPPQSQRRRARSSASLHLN
ncbi:hypothetical protein APUTEX25_004341, partial [Auxenochlorella protothecoides]